MHINIYYNIFLCVICSLLHPVFPDEDYIQFMACCKFKEPDFKFMEYDILSRYNKKNVVEYNSTQGKWRGFTPYSIEVAKSWNQDPFDPKQRSFEEKTLCTDNIAFVKSLVNLMVKPTIKLHSVKRSTDRHPGLLVCSAYNFYPKQIQVTWLQNGQQVTSGVSCSEVVSDGDWYYQVHCYLEYHRGDTITCMVEHATLSEPVLQVWDDSLPVPERIQIAVGLCGLMLGLVILSSGFFYYRRKCAAYVARYQGQELISAEGINAAGAT